MPPTRSALLAAALAVGLAGSALAQPAPAGLTAALADPSRPAADVERDVARKPAQILAFAGVEPGDKVVDLIMGGGYFTRILSAAVGPKGQVTAYQPAEFIQYRAAYADEQKAAVAGRANVTALSTSLGSLDLPDGLDLVMTVQNYHDLHLGAFPKDTADKVNAEVFKSLKPGGVYLIIDHEATAGSGLAAVDKLHRIDVAAVKAEVAAAGFTLAGESQLLDMPSDPRTANVFDPAIRGRTDQFILRFVKP